MAKETTPADATSSAAKKQQEPLKSNQILVQAKFSEASFRRTVWYAEIAHGVTLKDVARPEYWANVAAGLVARDRIECYAEDGSFYAEFMVKKVPEKTATKPVNWAAVTLIRYVDLTKDQSDSKPAAALPAGFESFWKDPVSQWCVRRKSDGQTLTEKNSSQSEAHDAFILLSKSMVAA